MSLLRPEPLERDAMRTLEPQPTIVEQAYGAILDAICEGRLEPGERLTQESVAAKLDVSRQPVGQALLLLKQQKFLVEAGRRGLMVAPLDRDFMRWIYELRLGIDPLAASLATHRAAAEVRERGEAILDEGRRAVREGGVPDLIRADMAFHMLLYEASGNRLFADLMGDLWNHLRRAMREVLLQRDYRRMIWTEHEQILRAIGAGDAEAAAALARAHLVNAAHNVEIALPKER
ncbi:MAG TPA: GntR family transcriptional regulator [Casimicrobiaceae bacterium]|nr:GntR family transcriptional regulator [Casimicrobiaceae bacterium]